MKTTLIASALIALSVAASGSAFAQRGDHNDRHEQAQQNNDRYEHGNDYSQRGDHGNDRDERNGQMQRQYNDRHDNDRFDHRGNSEYHRNDMAQHYHRDDMRGGGPRHDLRRGQRLSREYRDNRYVVSDWRERQLSAPPRGQHWVRAGNDYVLATIATGLIAQVLLSN